MAEPIKPKTTPEFRKALREALLRKEMGETKAKKKQEPKPVKRHIIIE